MSEWEVVPAWEALKALQEGTHDVQYTRGDSGGWFYEEDDFVAGNKWKHRIRPKVRTVDVIGLPVPNAPNKISVELRWDCHDWAVILHYQNCEDEARRAYEAICAASK